MKNKILFITDNFYPETNAPASRTYDHCLEWVKAGYDIEVVTCQPNFPKGIIFEGYKNQLIQKEVINGIKVTRLWSFVYPNKGFILRILDFISFAVMATIYSFFCKFDTIITTSPQFFTNYAGYFNSVIRRKYWCMEVRDIWPESIAAVGSISKTSLIYRVLEWFEILFYNRANLIIVVTNSFKKIIKGKSKNKNILIIKNAVNTQLFNLNLKNDLQPAPFDNSKINVGYIGTHGMAHNLEFILKAAKKLENSNFHFSFTGHGAQKDFLVELAKKENIRNCTFYDSIEKKQVPQYVKALDIALVHLRPNPTFKTVIPSKIFEYAAMHTKILNGVEGEASEIIEDSKIGINYNPSDLDDFISKLKQLSELKINEECFNKFIKNNNRTIAANKLINSINQGLK